MATPTAGSRTLTETSSGSTVHVRPGDRLEVSLPGGAAGGYTEPSSSDTSVRRLSASGGYPSDQPAQATFVADRRGTADLSSVTDYRCLHTSPRCLPPQRQWIVHVVVSG